jgi:hypothetical protein
MLRELLRVYAMRAREFSDAVAALGKHDHLGPGFLTLIKEIRERQQLCVSTCEKLDQYIEQEGRAAQVSAPGHTLDELNEEMTKAKKETVAARERYVSADNEFRILAAQAYDVGLAHPDGVLAMRLATANLYSAMVQYHTAVGTLTELLQVTPRTKGNIAGETL